MRCVFAERAMWRSIHCKLLGRGAKALPGSLKLSGSAFVWDFSRGLSRLAGLGGQWPLARSHAAVMLPL